MPPRCKPAWNTSAGRLAEAERAYRQFLAAHPNHAQAIYLLATIAMQAGKPAVAVELLKTAIRIDGGQAAFHATLGEAYQALDRAAEAMASYRQALRLREDFAAVHSNLGMLLQSQGDTAGEAASFQQAIRFDPLNAMAHHNLGVVWQVSGDFERAVTQFAEAVRLQPAYRNAQLKLGQALYKLGRASEALPWFEAVAAASPDWAAGHSALGVLYQGQKRHAAAAACYRRAIAADASHAEAHYNLATVLWELERHLECVAAYQEAIQLKPANYAAQLNMGGVYLRMGRPDEAAAADRQAIAIRPRSAPAWGQLAGAVQTQGKMDEAIATFRHVIALDPTDAINHSNLVYALNFHPGYDAATVAAEHRAWAARHAEPLTAAARAPHANDRGSERRLRVGYLSSHFRHHAVSFFIEPVIAAHDRQRFEVFLYGDVPECDATTERYRAMELQWRDIAGLPDEEVAQRIREDRIDILVDLAGHIGGNRLLTFAHKPAPVQVTYLGYQNTTGMSAMDYRLTDAHADPPGQTDEYYSEQLIRLPGSFFCYQPPADAPDVNELPALSRGYVTFASLNHINKLTDEAFRAWARILKAVPDSRLLVLAYTAGELERHIRQLMAGQGVEAERVEMADKRPRREYLELHHQIDVAIDTFPFNGHTTVCDALWMGVPSVMMEGDRYASRFGGSGLVTLGLQEWIARDADEYVAIAANMAGDLPRLAELRRTLRERLAASPLCDAAGFARKLEAAYRQMWNTWCTSSGR